MDWRGNGRLLEEAGCVSRVCRGGRSCSSCGAVRTIETSEEKVFFSLLNDNERCHALRLAEWEILAQLLISLLSFNLRQSSLRD